LKKLFKIAIFYRCPNIQLIDQKRKKEKENTDF